jgi:zinc transport system substrate-binding protein
LNKAPGADFRTITSQYNKRLIRLVKIFSNYHKKLTPCKDTPVMASAMQADFAESLGLNVTARYGRAEDMAPADLIVLVKKGKKAGVKAVIDNLQSGSEAGLPFSGELGAAHVVFSNFPMFTKDAPTYEALYAYNCDLLIKALEKGTGK